MLSEFIENRYIPYIKEHKRSWQTDVRYVRRHVLPYLGRYQLSEITTRILDDWRHELLNAGLSVNTCYRMFWLVKYILNCAVRWKVLGSDAAFRDAACPRGKPRCPSLLTAAEKQKLLELLCRYSDNASARAIHLLCLTGASKSEILYARWKDMDLQKRVLVTRRTPSGEARCIFLSDEAVRLIRSFPRRPDVPWMFYREESGSRVVTVFALWNKVRRELGRPDLRLNDLRHVFVHTLLQRGADYREVCSKLGHYSEEVFNLQSQMQYEQQTGTSVGGSSECLSLRQ